MRIVTIPNLEQHEMVWDNEKGCYYNNISLKQVEKISYKIPSIEMNLLLEHKKTEYN